MAPLSWLCVVVGASMLSPLPFTEVERGGQSHCFAIAIIITSTRCRVHHSNELFIATFLANFAESPECELGQNGVLGSTLPLAKVVPKEWSIWGCVGLVGGVCYLTN